MKVYYSISNEDIEWQGFKFRTGVITGQTPDEVFVEAMSQLLENGFEVTGDIASVYNSIRVHTKEAKPFLYQKLFNAGVLKRFFSNNIV